MATSSPPPSVKPCSACSEAKPCTPEFYCFRKSGPQAGQPLGICRACQAKYDKARRADNLEARRAEGRARAKAAYHADPASHQARARDWRKQNREKCRKHGAAARTKYLYGITRDEYEAKLANQGTRCMICGSTDPGKQGLFHLDHDHETGVIRDFLCSACNQGLGYFKDDPLRLELAAAYLRRHART